MKTKLDLLLLLGLLGLVNSCGAYSVINKTVGDEVKLGSGSKVDDGIAWLHDGDTVAEWYKDQNITYYESCKDRCKVDHTTGNLTISNLTLNDSGYYTAEINNKVLKPIKLQVFLPVPEPTIIPDCDDEKTHCVLTCEVNTTGVGPVTYSWWSDNKKINESKELIITKKEMNSTFICEVENPVGSKRSEEFNPVNTSKNQNPTIQWIFVIFICLVGVVIVAVIVAVGVAVVAAVCIGLFYRHKERRVNFPTVHFRTIEPECEIVEVVTNGAEQMGRDGEGTVMQLESAA